ncbi:Arf-GAP with SH3 domain, ANK repeat and PH domain-containing protein 1, partial [Varanus komodoensis]
LDSKFHLDLSFYNSNLLCVYTSAPELLKLHWAQEFFQNYLKKIRLTMVKCYDWVQTTQQTNKVALRKIETIHLPSVDKSSQHSEIFQKSSSLSIDLPQKPQPGDLPPKPQPLELSQKPQIGDLPPKPGELPPKPQLGDLPPKPQLADLPPKPQMKDLPPKPQLGDSLVKTPGGEVSSKSQSSEANQKSHSVDLSPKVHSKETIQKQSSEDSNDVTHALPETPVPLPRKINMGKNKIRRVKTIYDCQADNDDELTFVEGEVIIVTGEEDQEWWIGHIEGKPERKGVFPVSFVHILSD